MYIQNVGNPTQAPQPALLSGNGASGAAVASPSNVPARPGVAAELPQVIAKQIGEQRLSAEQLKNVVDSINKALKQTNSNLEFSVDADTHETVVKLVDTETGDVIRQFPSKEMLAISRSIDQVQQGLLLKQKA